MKSFFLFILIFIAFAADAQIPFKAHPIRLPADVAYYDNQYSSLYISEGKLYMMSESRLEDHAEAFLTSVDLPDLDKAVRDSNYQAMFAKNPIYYLDILRNKIAAENQTYEGLEASVVKNGVVYLSIETTTPSKYCFLIKGYFHGNDIYMDTTKLLKLEKPTDAAGQEIYNAGFESVELIDNKLYAFFEYNYFPEKNFAYAIDTSLNENSIQKIPINKMPFRLTDVTNSDEKNHLIGINYFYAGGGKDEIYRVPETDKETYKLTKDSTGFRSYCRLVDIRLEKDKFVWKPFAALPAAYWAYNWEGLALYKNGFFITNDKYTPKRPYATNLLYLEMEK